MYGIELIGAICIFAGLYFIGILATLAIAVIYEHNMRGRTVKRINKNDWPYIALCWPIVYLIHLHLSLFKINETPEK